NCREKVINNALNMQTATMDSKTLRENSVAWAMVQATKGTKNTKAPIKYLGWRSSRIHQIANTNTPPPKRVNITGHFSVSRLSAPISAVRQATGTVAAKNGPNPCLKKTFSFGRSHSTHG